MPQPLRWLGNRIKSGTHFSTCTCKMGILDTFLSVAPFSTSYQSELSGLQFPPNLTYPESFKRIRLPKFRKRGKKRSGNFHYRLRPTTKTELDGIDLRDQDESSKPSSSSKRRLTPWINYETFQWSWFLTLCILAIADRFAWNVWPRQTYSIGSGSAGSDRLVGYKPG